MEFKTLEHSFQLLKKNPIVFLPNLFQIFISYILLLSIYYYTGASSLAPLLNSTEKASLEMISTFISTNLLQIIISVVSFVVITFIVGVGVMIFKYSLIKEIINNKKVSLKNAWKDNRDLFWHIILLRIILFVICLILLAISGLFSLLLYYLISLVSTTLAPYFAIFFGLVLMSILLLIFKFMILFRYPIMFMKRIKHPVKVLKESYGLFKQDKWFVIYTWFVMAVIGLLFSIITYSLNAAVTSLTSLLQMAAVVMLLYSVWLILDVLIGLTGELWMEIYLFVKYSKRAQTS